MKNKIEVGKGRKREEVDVNFLRVKVGDGRLVDNRKNTVFFCGGGAVEAGLGAGGRQQEGRVGESARDGMSDQICASLFSER
jgi:hypothetical protein